MKEIIAYEMRPCQESLRQDSNLRPLRPEKKNRHLHKLVL